MTTGECGPMHESMDADAIDRVKTMYGGSLRGLRAAINQR
jgi:hypothetical protein